MDTILYPIMWIIAWIMSGVHSLLTTLGMSDGAGVAWVLSIVGLTVVVRALMIPLFNKQTKAARLGQQLNPEIQKIQKKYKGRKDPLSQQRQQEEMMALYREHGTSPFASCMPVLIQMPIFFSLFRLLYAVLPLSEGKYMRPSIGPINETVAKHIAESKVFGAPLASSIGTSSNFSSPRSVIVVAVVLIALMIATLFFTQKQLMTKNMPDTALDPSNPAYKMQKYMLYGMPLIYIFTGTTFQIGVLVYWLTGNIWNIGQQTWMLNNNPTPGSEAYRQRQEKLRQKRIAKGLSPEEDADDSENQGGQRVQPLGKARSKKAAAKNVLQEPTPSEEKNESSEVRGLDGLTDAERAQKRYERRLAERRRAQEKKNARKKQQQNNKKDRNF
ncbi:membrane protein insertase YidC [Arcanobacterium bovis]|uniref:Membrane protein insertase YidC n=1 Tax=Arcanobacterium bovis TaxID=2529275 RepID=A0A4Q9V0W8_9ACTO|nr:membrane protein insertase YidC [Arcanobacterium bovis]TBW21030.1 membrane protein insertase YidC [Arcanobacterium bovis]